MIVYKATAEGEASKNPDLLLFKVSISRQIDGGEWKEIATFHERYSAAIADQVIANEIWKRVENFAAVDGGTILAASHDLRAKSIAEALTDRGVEI